MPLTPVYRIAQTFLNIQAVSTAGVRHGALADPVGLEVVLTRGAENLQHEIDRANAASAASQGRLRQVRTGNWIYQLDPAQLEPGVSYTLRWRFEMTPGNVNVDHQSFTWSPVPALPSSPENVVLFGMLADTLGIPATEKNLIMETFDDVVTLSRRTGQVELTTDVFGLWHVEVPRGKILRFVFNELSKLVEAPAEGGRVALSDLPDYQLTDNVRRDRYGYPVPR